MIEPSPAGSPAIAPHPAGDAPSRLRHMPRTVALTYLSVGALWIFFTDRLLVWLHFSTPQILAIQTFKGWLFVVGSAALVFVLLKRYERAHQHATLALIESQNEVKLMNAELEKRVTDRTLLLESANRELEAFAYAVSHDLRAPLRSMSGFSQILQETAHEALDQRSRDYLRRICDSSVRMSMLIDDLLSLSRISRSEMVPRTVSLSQIASEAASTIQDRYPGRNVALAIDPDMMVCGDTRLLRLAMENLLDNAWKYSAHTQSPQVKVGSQPSAEGTVYFVQDNGVGFDMAYASKLFGPFQRLHAESQFPGTGIGLVTVQRIVARHGGRIWAHAELNQGATFYFTLCAQ